MGRAGPSYTIGAGSGLTTREARSERAAEYTVLADEDEEVSGELLFRRSSLLASPKRLGASKMSNICMSNGDGASS